MSVLAPPGAPAATGPDTKKHGFLARYHFILRRLHSLTGLMFGGYLLVHLTVNATLIEGARHEGHITVFQGLVNYIHSLPFLEAVEWAFIFLPIIFHTIYGIYVTAIGQPNIGRYGYTRNWLYLFQRITAVIILLFLLFHVLTLKGVFGDALPAALKFQPDAATLSTIQHLNYDWWVWGVIYPLGVLASAFHLANGFYAAAITWGLTISSRAQKRWGVVCALVFLGSFAAAMTALVAGIVNADLAATAAATQPVVLPH